MHSRDDVIAHISKAFARTPFPGTPFLVGGREGSEPDEIGRAFAPFARWGQPDAAFLDRHYVALSFLSEGGFRFFLPAYLIADLQGHLQTADPVFHLTHGFSDQSILLNPRRYGAVTFFDYARFRLSVFAREEAQAIVAYLQHQRDTDTVGVTRSEITAALDAFWLDRAAHAPDHDALEAHLAREVEEFAAIQEPSDRPPGAGPV
jgi:hypothetical protein